MLFVNVKFSEMFSHEIFQTQMSSVMAAVVEAAVSELSRLLDECATMTSKRCSSPTSHNMIVIKAENGITEEGTQFINPLTVVTYVDRDRDRDSFV